MLVCGRYVGLICLLGAGSANST